MRENMVEQRREKMPINGSGLGLLAMLKLPAIAVGGLGAVGVVLMAFGFGFSTPGAQLEVFVEGHESEHVVINDTLSEIDRHMEEQQILLEAMIRGDCIRESVENLQRQGLSQKCSELGIER